ncbi:MAG TPA: hypothetical protein GX694_08785 [Actinomycetales bacterium]|nr:hypothetical protein [Actinomycetales bacterium]
MLPHTSDQKPLDYRVFLSLLLSDPGSATSPDLAAMLDEFVAAHGVDCVDRDGRTLLMSAVSRSRPDLVAGLVARGAMTFDADAPVVALLLAHGADPAVANDHVVAPENLLG